MLAATGPWLMGALVLRGCGADGGAGLCAVVGLSGLGAGGAFVGLALIVRHGGNEPRRWLFAAALAAVGVLVGIPMFWLASMWIPYLLERAPELR